MTRKKILFLYHSGSGGTKTIIEIYYKLLKDYERNIYSIEDKFDYREIEEADFLIIGFPTYHCEPSSSISSFIQNLPRLSRKVRAFIFTTYGLYAGNTLRMFAHASLTKNIEVVGHADYRSPATDGVLFFPRVTFIRRYEKNIDKHISKDVEIINSLLKNDSLNLPIPQFKLYTILNYPHQYFGKTVKYKIKVDESNCILCDKCVKRCPHSCWSSKGDYPVFDSTNCESCYRCIHHCPKSALVLSKKTPQRQKLNTVFYKTLQNEILRGIED